MVAVLVSGFVSLTLTPMLCSRFVKPPSHAKQAAFTLLPKDFSTACSVCTIGRFNALCGIIA